MFPFRSIALIIFSAISICSSLNVTIVHVNDVHCRFLSFNGQNRPCKQKDYDKNECWGGAARRMTLINKIRKEQKNVLLMNAGDEYQGTIWFTEFQWKPIAEYMNLMRFDAMTFGNHEFDNRLEGLAPFVDNMSVPFVCSNLDSRGTILENKYKTSLEFTIEGEKIGVIGYVSSQTPALSKPGDKIKFLDEIESLKKAVSELQAKGINKIIALGHSGITTDRNICKQVKGVDLVVGGHTNTFLYTGTPPSTEHPEGVYPEVYTETGENCLVVQEYAYGKYLGFLQVDFDANGVIKKWNGNPILVDKSIAEEQTVADLLKPYSKKLEAIEQEIVAETAVPLTSMGMTCKQHECIMGNVMADAFVYQYSKKKWQDGGQTNITGWSPAAIAVMNSGGLREYQIESMRNLTLGDFHTILPFGDTVQMVAIKGKYIRQALEHSVEDFYIDDTHGKFLQMSGIKVLYDLKKSNGQKVIDVVVRCADCDTPHYEPLDNDKVYNLITNSYLLEGGNGYYMLSKNFIHSDYSDILDIDLITEYFKRYQPMTGEIEGRITFVTDDLYKSYCSSNTNVLHCSFITIVFVFIISRFV